VPISTTRHQGNTATCADIEAVVNRLQRRLKQAVEATLFNIWSSGI